MSSRGQGERGGCCAVFFLLAVPLHLWLIEEVPVTNPSGFVDGVAHGFLAFVTAVRKACGAELHIKLYDASWTYDLGVVVGASLLLTLVQAWSDYVIGRAILGYAEKAEELVLALAVVATLVIAVPCLIFTDSWSPAVTPPPPLFGAIPGREPLATVGGCFAGGLLVLVSGVGVLDAVSRWRRRR